MKKSVWLLFLMLLFSSCTMVFPLDTEVPYSVKGEMVLTENESDDFSEFKFEFKNKSEKEVYAFTVVFFLFDQEGNPVTTGKPNISAIVREPVPSGEILESSFSLDRFLNGIPEVPYRIEYLFVKKIIYSDGTEWNDPYGFKSL